MPTLRINGALLLVGGPTLKISVGGKVFHFEDHSYCGPMPINRRTGGELAKVPAAFWHAVTQWHQQGKRIEDGLCRWDHEPEPITKHMGGRHHKVVAWTAPRRGE